MAFVIAVWEMFLRIGLYLEERNVYEGSIVIDELENKHLESERILILRLSPRNLQAGEPSNQLLVDLEMKHK